LKDKVAALLYADSGTEAPGMLETGSLELLVLSTSAWLEVNSLRKSALKENSAAHAVPPPSPPTETPQPAPVHMAPAYHDPFASHASGHAMAAAAATGAASPSAVASAVAAPLSTLVSETTVEEAAVAETTLVENHVALPDLPMPVEMDPGFIEQVPLTLPNSEIEANPAPPPALPIAPEHQEVHRKAERFARLLVDEIKLYNQAKVADGRRNKDLYDRLQEAIEKSRAMYLKRYGDTAAASANYFQREIIRGLAEDDLSVMGANFRQ
jgi:hypothetical protein